MSIRNFFLISLFLSTPAWGMYTNYNSVLLGSRAAGMGGAFTAMTGDTSASPYYNPATLARAVGSSLSAAASLYNKYDVSYGSQDSLDDAIFRINKGSILTIPSASGMFTNFNNFTVGLSILVPQFINFGGEVDDSDTNSTFLRLDTESLWVGGSFAFNPDEKSAVGFTFYYTSDSDSRSLTHRFDDAGDVIVYNEEKTFSSNSIVAIIGYFYEVNAQFQWGASYRLHSVPIYGEGSYLSSQVGTVSGAQPLVNKNKISGETKIPDRLAIGISYQLSEKNVLALDMVYFGEAKYSDLESFGDMIEHDSVVNYHLGFDHEIYEWLNLRLGLFTDYSSSPDIPSAPTRRYADQIDKLGFSANFKIQSTQNTHLSLGGYYVGGEGHASERSGSGFARIDKQDRVFSFLVSSGYQF
jgi:hypothetical protein